jgi:hypothetical protein
MIETPKKPPLRGFLFCDIYLERRSEEDELTSVVFSDREGQEWKNMVRIEGERCTGDGH